MLPFDQVDVFTDELMLGNPVAVVHDAEALTDDQMSAFARWTNLSETTFLLAPSDPSADYRVRIFTPSRELPFAGHPTLGSARAWLNQGGVPQQPGLLVQQCGAGLVRVRQDGSRFAFAAPPLVRDGPVAADDLVQVARALSIAEAEIVEAQWVDNGPGWVVVLLADARSVLDLEPDPAAMGQLKIGVVGRYPEGSEAAFEVRAFSSESRRSGDGQPQRRHRPMADRCTHSTADLRRRTRHPPRTPRTRLHRQDRRRHLGRR